jgi:hypothetical protein
MCTAIAVDVMIDAQQPLRMAGREPTRDKNERWNPRPSASGVGPREGELVSITRVLREDRQ